MRLATRRRLALGGVAVAVLALAAIVLASVLPGSGHGATTPSAPAGTATVQRRDLVSTDSESGTLGYGDPRTVFDRLSGTITWLPAAGAVVHPGQTLFKVDDEPVVLMDGSVPAYRSLAEGDSGPDVAELDRNLIAFGDEAPRAVGSNQTFDATTAAAVEHWQSARGLPVTGSVELGRVVFLPGSRRVSSVQAQLGSAGGSGTGGASGAGGAAAGGTTGVAYEGGAPVRFVEAAYVTRARDTSTTTTTTTTTTTSTRTVRAPAPRPRPAPHRPAGAPSRGGGAAAHGGSDAATLRELAQALKALARAQRRGSSGSSAGLTRTAPALSSSRASVAPSTQAAAPSVAVMQTSSTDPEVTVQLDATKQEEARVGAPVTVELPSQQTVRGHITAVSAVAQPTQSGSGASGSGGGGSSGSGGGSSSGAPSAVVPVTIALTGRSLPALDQAAVTVTFQQSVARAVLSVPVTALVATAGGHYAVEVVEGARRRLVPVTPGVFAGGYVEVTGADLQPGEAVTNAGQ